MIEFIKETVDIYKTHEYIDNITNIIEGGTSADRQISLYNKTKDSKLVVDSLILETAKGL